VAFPKWESGAVSGKTYHFGRKALGTFLQFIAVVLISSFLFLAS